MKLIYSQLQELHQPVHRLSYGLLQKNLENNERAEVLRAALQARGWSVTAPNDFGFGPIEAVHTPDYLAFLQQGYAEWRAIANAGPEIRPSVHPNRYMGHVPLDILGRAGHYIADTGTAIGEGTWAAAYASAQTALQAADLVAHGERAAYALCRPPGHHAYADMAGGFCFLNNAAIAAEHLRRSLSRVAIVDVDVHHGNGTQQIFLPRNDVLFVSVHGDPAQLYPYYAGYAEERGQGDGIGYTVNLPLPLGSGDDDYLRATQVGLDKVHDFKPDALIVSLGLDFAEDDPFRCMQVTTDGFRRLGHSIGRAGLPTVLLQEGGYVSPALGENLVAFLDGFEMA